GNVPFLEKDCRNYIDKVRRLTLREGDAEEILEHFDRMQDTNSWVIAFVKDTFWAGMSTTQRSESMYAFFDRYVNSKTTLKQFVE
ncbi:hypothetical protein CFOL_v3_21587, partial [Cephalotus follicularis]